ncbi:MAG TPA: hypothetical protein VHQ65_12410 [Thermoanaerobaculia bacterium]|nr:hypothetical protein [Thermoanaerobaculia bacterium]
MAPEKKIFWIVLVVIVIVVAVLLFGPEVRERRGPQPKAAWVAIEADGAGVAVVGPVEIAAGTPFTLHAVLEAEQRDGTPLYYTRAPALEIGGERVPPDRVRPWDRPDEAQVTWFTVEGSVPYLRLQEGQGTERLEFKEFLRSDWPYSWSLDGRLEPAHDDILAGPSVQLEWPFGTQRYQVRIAVGGEEEDVLARERFVSWGAAELPAEAERFPTVTAALPGPAAPASAVFGLSQLEPVADEAAQLPGDAVAGGQAGRDALREELVRLTAARLAFARLPLLAEVIAATGTSPGAVAWGEVALDGTVAWDRVATGDLLRAGGRVVMLYRDAAPPAPGNDESGAADHPETPGAGNGRLDRDDLVFDYARGAAVRRLSDVFAGEGGVVQWAPLASGP